MASLESPSTQQRGLTLITIAGLHAAILVAVLSIHSPPITRAPILSGLRLTFIASPRQDRATPPPPLLPSRIADRERTGELSPPSLSSDPTANGVAATGCDAPTVIAAAIQNDPEAVQSLLNAPVDTHTPAGAVAVWNVDWNPSTAAALAPLRTRILAAIESVDPVCLDEDLRGPRFVDITAGAIHYILVFGSDVWRWDSLRRPLPATPAQLATGSVLPSPSF